jgi:hypothetical protein
MQIARIVYRTLSAVYVAKLHTAHTAAHGSVEFFDQIREANIVGYEFAASRRRYQAAVSEILTFYKGDHMRLRRRPG